MVEAEFLLELLMRLLTDPSGFDRGGEHLEARIGRQVRHIVFLLAGRSAFADEPDLVARHALHSVIEHAVLMAIRHADTAGREETCQPAFRAPPPANLSPFSSSQQRFGSDRELIRDVVLAGPSRLRDGEDQSNVGEINVLASRQTRRPQQTALTQSLTERPAGAVPGIGKDAAETRPLKHRIAYVAFLTSVNRTDEGKAAQGARAVKQADEDAHEAASGVGEDAVK